MSVHSEDQVNNFKVHVLLPAARVKLFDVSVVFCMIALCIHMYHSVT